MFRLFAKDLVRPENLRTTESPEVVLEYWTKNEDVYEPEIPPKSAPAKARSAYFALVAERVFLRTKVLGRIDPQTRLHKHRELLAARPFGPGTPRLSDLLGGGVRAAMANIPFINPGDRSAQLARLYCISGFDDAYPPPFRDGKVKGSGEFAWFLAGYDSPVQPVGRSWCLAASILIRCIRDGNPANVRNALATEFITTGNVSARGDVDRLPMLPDKLVLATCLEFEHLTWLVPSANRDDMVNVKFAAVPTVDKAYERVAKGDSLSRELHDIVKREMTADKVPVVLSMLRGDADANLQDQDGWNVRQLLMSNINRKIVRLIRTPGLAGKKVVEIQNEVRRALAPEWDAEKASSYYGNAPLLFFLAARRKDADLMKVLQTKYNINATDRDGETALDFALECKDEETAKFLLSHGAERRIYEINSKHVRAFLRDPEEAMQRDRGFITAALDNGLDPFRATNFGTEGGKPIVVSRKRWDSLRELESAAPDPWNSEPWVDVEYTETTIFLEAVFLRHHALVQMCLEHAPEELPPISVYIRETNGYITNYLDLARRFSSPAIVKCIESHVEKTCKKR